MRSRVLYAWASATTPEVLPLFFHSDSALEEPINAIVLAARLPAMQAELK